MKRDGATFFKNIWQRHSLLSWRENFNPRHMGAPPRCPDWTFPSEKLKVRASARDPDFSFLLKRFPGSSVQVNRNFAAARDSPKSSICFYSCSRLRSFRNRLFAKVGKVSVLLCNSEPGHKILNETAPKWISRLPCDTGTPAPSRGWWPPDPGYLAPPDAPPAPTLG